MIAMVMLMGKCFEDGFCFKSFMPACYYKYLDCCTAERVGVLSSNWKLVGLIEVLIVEVSFK